MSTTSLHQFILDHTERGACKCGRCVDKDNIPDPRGHTVHMTFMMVSLRGDEPRETMADEFKTLSREWPGDPDTWDGSALDVLDGEWRNYMQLGAWLGDQGLALQYMALGTLLDVFDLISPAIKWPDVPEDVANTMAANGLLLVRAKP